MASPTISAPVRPTRLSSRDRHVSSTSSRGARTSPASRVATRAPRVSQRISPGLSTRVSTGVSTRVSPRATARSTASPVRLTHRGRLTAFAASLAALAVVVLGAGQIADASDQPSTVEPMSIVVQAGETLWGIARDAAPGHDPRLVISQIRDLNDLGTRSIVPGQTLIVPTLG